jgi:molecular chaperone Hsp33
MMQEGKTPEDILNIILEGLNPRILDKVNVGFECECSHEKGKEVLTSIGKHELSQIIEEDKEAEIGCQFCNSKYKYTEEELLELLNNME